MAPAEQARQIPAAVSAATPVDLARAVVAAVRDLLSRADAALAAQWEDEQRVVVLGELDRVSELVGVYRGRVLAAHRADGRWARDGDRSFVAWRGRVTEQGSGSARSEVELADGLVALRFLRPDGDVLGPTNRSAGARRLAGSRRAAGAGHVAGNEQIGAGRGPAGTSSPAEPETVPTARRTRRPVPASGFGVITVRIDAVRTATVRTDATTTDAAAGHPAAAFWPRPRPGRYVGTTRAEAMGSHHRRRTGLVSCRAQMWRRLWMTVDGCGIPVDARAAIRGRRVTRTTRSTGAATPSAGAHGSIHIDAGVVTCADDGFPHPPHHR